MLKMVDDKFKKVKELRDRGAELAEESIKIFEERYKKREGHPDWDDLVFLRANSELAVTKLKFDLEIGPILKTLGQTKTYDYMQKTVDDLGDNAILVADDYIKKYGKKTDSVG